MMDMARIRGVAALLLGGALMVTGCSSGGSGDVSAGDAAGRSGPTPSISSTVPSPTATASGAHRPWSDVNPRPRRAGSLVVKVLALSRLAPGTDHGRVHPGGPGFWREEVRTCVRRSSPHAEVVRLRDWRAVGLDGRRYVASVAPDRPAYPARRRLAPGDCTTGWWLIAVPHDRPVRAIQLAPAGARPLLEWMSMR